MSVVVSYYSLTRDVWEPILEPVMNPKDDKAPPILWFMKMEVRVCHATPPFSKATPSLSHAHIHR